MRQIIIVSLFLYSATSAFAQAQPHQAPQQLSDNYNPAAPVYNQPQFAPAHVQPQQAQPAAPAHAAQAAQPWDYGQSVATDIRQMNF